MRVFSVAHYLIASCLDSILHFVMQFPRRTRAASRKKNNDRQNVLSQTMSGLQSLSQLSALAPTGLSLCLPIVITIIESVEVSSHFSSNMFHTSINFENTGRKIQSRAMLPACGESHGNYLRYYRPNGRMRNDQFRSKPRNWPSNRVCSV